MEDVFGRYQNVVERRGPRPSFIQTCGRQCVLIPAFVVCVNGDLFVPKKRSLKCLDVTPRNYSSSRIARPPLTLSDRRNPRVSSTNVEMKGSADNRLIETAKTPSIKHRDQGRKEHKNTRQETTQTPILSGESVHTPMARSVISPQPSVSVAQTKGFTASHDPRPRQFQTPSPG